MEANAQLCADLTSLDAALDAYGSPDLESTKAELDDATQAVSDAWDAVKNSADALADVRSSKLTISERAEFTTSGRRAVHKRA